MFALRLLGVSALLALIWWAGIGAYSDKVKEAAEVDLKSNSTQSPAAEAPAGEIRPTVESLSKELVEARDAATKQKQKGRWQALVVGLTVFVLAVFVGFEVIAKVPPTLHTPLMSGSNAISGITVVGAVTIAGFGWGFSSLLGMLAVALAMINVVGGFLVTHRMLAMFKRK